MLNVSELKIVDGVFADVKTGRQVRFEPILIQGQGWTVGRVTGSRVKDKTIRVEPGYETCAYTLYEAQQAAGVLTRDLWRALNGQHGAATCASGSRG